MASSLCWQTEMGESGLACARGPRLACPCLLTSLKQTITSSNAILPSTMDYPTVGSWRFIKRAMGRCGWQPHGDYAVGKEPAATLFAEPIRQKTRSVILIFGL